MELIERHVGDVTVLTISGRLVVDNASILKDKVASLLFQGRRRLVFNLAGLTYMDSSGLGEMVACYTSAVKAQGVIKLTHATERVHDLLSITKLVTVFESFGDEAEAIESFGA